MTDQQLEFTQFIRLIIDLLEQTGVKYLIGGALAVWEWGSARSTQDIDFVVDLPYEHMVALSAALAEHDMLVPVEIMFDLWIETRADLAVNIIHPYTGYKAELFLLRDGDELRKLALERRRKADLGDPIGEVYVHSPEDLILYKLQYYIVSRQTKHPRDIASILQAQSTLDMDYLNQWIDRLDVRPVWEEILANLDAPDPPTYPQH